MKKYTSGAFVSTTYGIYNAAMDTITSFPASIIANGGNITPWAIYGNTVEGVSVGDRTNNLFNDFDIIGRVPSTSNGELVNIGNGACTDLIEVSEALLTMSIYESIVAYIFLYDANQDFIGWKNITSEGNITTESITDYENTKYVRIRTDTYSQYLINKKIMLNTGSTALLYEPYGYKLTVVIGNNTTNIYMADVLRMSSGADPVYDIMSSTGVITRNVDTDGTPLVTPTTESFTAPTLATVAGSQSVSFDTTVKPSRAELTYTGWHTHSDKKRSGGAWT